MQGTLLRTTLRVNSGLRRQQHSHSRAVTSICSLMQWCVFEACIVDIDCSIRVHKDLHSASLAGASRSV